VNEDATSHETPEIPVPADVVEAAILDYVTASTPATSCQKDAKADVDFIDHNLEAVKWALAQDQAKSEDTPSLCNKVTALTVEPIALAQALHPIVQNEPDAQLPGSGEDHETPAKEPDHDEPLALAPDNTCYYRQSTTNGR
jgi:hypothetical protein